MSFPLAIAPTVRTPGLALLINLLAGIASLGSQPNRGLVMAVKSSAGTITPDTQIVQAIAGSSDAGTYFGAGTPGHLACKRIFEESPLAQIDIVSPAVNGSSAQATGTWTFALGAPPLTSPLVVTGYVCGRSASYTWAAGVSAATAAAGFSAAMNALVSDLPVSIGVSGAVVTASAKVNGTIGNDVQISVTVTGTITGSASVTASGSKLSGGTLAPDLTNALALVSNKEYDLICDAASDNTDGTAASSTSTVSQINTTILANDQGFNAKLQQAVFGVTSTLSAAMTGTAYQNSGVLECIFGFGFLSMPQELAGAEVGARLREEGIDPAVNRIQMLYRSKLYPNSDLVTFGLTPVQVESALQNGVTPVTYNASSKPCPSRPITTYFKDGNGNADDRLLDTSRVTGTFAIAKDIRVNLPLAFPGAKLSPDLPPNSDPPPAGVVEVRDIRSWLIARMRGWVSRGVASAASVENSIADGTLLVQVDPVDPSQCDIVIPETTVPPLAKYSVVINQIGT